ncbi:hypothetical protein PVAP13_9NG639201 [Panicum virgatum]|uniref:Uncharacterized protein n=1 Tax=Panicum virgatum TaxID=38727 RepID=A0A8T0MZ76_PANVG|nr:hypothetical protein PVAP13_9NG639201 [Panicum virgatum]
MHIRRRVEFYNKPLPLMTRRPGRRRRAGSPAPRPPTLRLTALLRSEGRRPPHPSGSSPSSTARADLRRRPRVGDLRRAPGTPPALAPGSPTSAAPLGRRPPLAPSRLPPSLPGIAFRVGQGSNPFHLKVLIEFEDGDGGEPGCRWWTEPCSWMHP